ncbi:hypothetical protein [Paraburkholderia elongata]|nr:hypothetical protein [Paraburkholderia elongata]
MDKSFVDDIEEDEDARALTQAVVSPGKASRLDVLAPRLRRRFDN